MVIWRVLTLLLASLPLWTGAGAARAEIYRWVEYGPDGRELGCGPTYRDWQNAETQFDATGANVASIAFTPSAQAAKSATLNLNTGIPVSALNCRAVSSSLP